MGVQPFELRQIDGRLGEALQRLLRSVYHAGALHKIIHPQGRGEAGRPAGRQHVARAGQIVPHRLGRVLAQKDRTGARYVGKEFHWLLHGELQVLGGDGVRDIDSLLDAGDDENA